MKRWVLGSVATGLLLTGCATASSEQGPAQQEGWRASDGVAFDALDPNSGTNPIAVGDLAVVLGTRSATGYDAASGETRWTTDLPELVCASAPAANADGVVAVLLGDGTGARCDRAAAIDTSDGTLLWSAAIPPYDRGSGWKVAVGDDTVVAVGECEGFTLFDVADGSVVSTRQATNTDEQCVSGASDGRTVVLAADDTLSTYDASTGAEQESWPAAGLTRLGDVLASDPLVVTGLWDRGGYLVDLSGPAPVQLGRAEGGFGGEPAGSARTGDTLWVQYDDTAALVGLDLTTHEETELPVDGATLLGAHDGRLLLGAGRALELVDPDDPQAGTATLRVPPGPGPTAIGVAVAADHLVRVWPSLVDAHPLP